MSHLEILKEAFDKIGIKYFVVTESEPELGTSHFLYLGDEGRDIRSYDHFFEFTEDGKIASY